MKRVAVEQLGGVPSGLYRTVGDALQQSSDDDVDAIYVREEEKVALAALRQRNAAHVMRFRQMIAEGFDEFHTQPLPGNREEPLDLVDDAQIDFHLVGQQLSESIAKRYTRPLKMLDGRLEALAAALKKPVAPNNPIGATRLANAFVSTFRDANVPRTLQMLMLRHYEQELGKVLGDLYGQINTLLASSGYGVQHAAQEPKAAATKKTDSAATSGGTATKGAAQGGSGRQDSDSFSRHGAASGQGAGAGDGETAGHGEAVDARTPDVEYKQLRSMLHDWRNGLLHDGGSTSEPAAAPGRRSPPRRELGVAEVVSVASLLQGDPPEPYVRGLTAEGYLADAIREQMSDGARRLGLNPDQTRLGDDEEDTIDLVGLLFESLFKTHALLDRSRRMYARLVLPYLKVALSDASLFVNREHPARRLLDAITEACEGNDGANSQDRELLERAAGAAQRIVADYHEDLEIFELVSSELEDFLKHHAKRVEMIERRAAESVHGRERLQHARNTAATELAGRLQDTPVTQAMSDFMVEHWQHHLVQTLLREGEQSERYRGALVLGDSLVDVDREAALGSGSLVADRLITMQPAIVRCLASSGLDGQAAETWMVSLVSALAHPDQARRVHEMPKDDGASDKSGLRLAGGIDLLDFDEDVAERMRGLAVGEWLRVVEKDEVASAKVAWISPLTGRLLLVNRRGIRVLVASPEQLAALAKAGRLVAGAGQAPFDEAMRELRSRLDRAA